MTQALVSRLVVHLPAPGHAPDVQALAQVADLQVQALAGFAIASAAPVGTTDWLDVFPGTAAQAHPDKIAARIDTETLVYNRWQLHNDTLVLSSDVLGLKPLYRATDAHGGAWFASSIADLLRINPAWAQPIDALGLHSLFIGRACWSDRTVHAAIRRVATGTVLQWSAAAGVRETRNRRWQMLEADDGRSFETATPDMRRTLEQGLDAWLAGDRADAQALSGGYDSRLIAALYNSPCRAVTYGSASMAETRQARKVAQALGLPQAFVALPDDLVFNQMGLATRLFDSTMDVALLQAYPLTGALPAGAVWLHGYPGDVIAGAFTTRMHTADFTSHASVAAAIVRSYAFQGVDAAKLFGFAFDRDALVADVAADLDQRVSPLAAYHLWCWESHLRRYTAGILCVMGETMDVRLPYVWKPYIDIWAKVPLHGLQHRLWFKRWFVQEFPTLAAIPHPDDVPPPIWQRGLARLVGAKLVAKLHRSEYIYDRPNLVSARYTDMAATDIATRRTDLAEALGLELQPGYENALDDPRYRLGQSRRILLGLAHYASLIKAA
jgi:hypothetical protein